MRNKKAISDVVIMLIMLAFVLGGAALVWVVVSNILSSSTEDVSSGFGQILLSMRIEGVNVNDDGSVSVSVKRNAGAGDLSGINFIFSDGVNSQIIKQDANLEELGTQTFTLAYSDLGSITFVKDVSIAPIIKDSSGKERVGNIVDEKELTKKQILQSLGAVSWWRFEGDARDEIGNNHGTLYGDTNFIDGKYGRAASFDGVGDYISVLDNPSLRIINYSVLVWIKPGTTTDVWEGIVGKPGRNYNFWLRDLGYVHHRFHTLSSYNSGGPPDTADGSILFNTWNFVALTNDGFIAKSHINGDEKVSAVVSEAPIVDNTNLIIARSLDGGDSAYFRGEIDELILFDRGLTNEQVKSLYEMGFN